MLPGGVGVEAAQPSVFGNQTSGARCSRIVVVFEIQIRSAEIVYRRRRALGPGLAQEVPRPGCGAEPSPLSSELSARLALP
jgi:hypothetical protein